MRKHPRDDACAVARVKLEGVFDRPGGAYSVLRATFTLKMNGVPSQYATE